MDNAKKKTDEAALDVALTRREWLLSLGSAIVLAGSSGAPGEAAPGVEHALPGVTVLPPGLYQPSFDHLTHVLTRDEPFVTIPPGAETEYIRPRSEPFTPSFFSSYELRIVRRWVEIILGEDLKISEQKSVPGAPASIYDEVAEWIDLVVASAPAVRALALSLPADQRALAVAYFGGEERVRALETFEPERVCRAGLAWLGEESRRRFAKHFLDGQPEEQLELVRAVSDARADKSAANAGTRLFDFLKAESVRGFYTSRVGLKELDYKGNSFYAESPGCALTPLPPATASEPD
jgi:Gluconate 2-dehydrogenase subunit 3